MAMTGSLISLDDVYRARERIGDRLHRTPLLTSATLSERVGADVRFKAELLQRTGSFKPRGVLNKLATLTDEEKERGVISISAGNHAQAVAYASASQGIEARVIAVEPERSAALHESLMAGEPVTVEAKSIADGLNGPYAGANCVRVCTELGVESVLVTEDALKEAFRFMYGRMKLACEVAGAATAAALLSGAVEVERGQTVAAVVSGGNVAPKTAAAILAAEDEG